MPLPSQPLRKLGFLTIGLFDGRDPETLQAARTAWRNAKEASHDATYWKESPNGKWERQG